MRVSRSWEIAYGWWVNSAHMAAFLPTFLDDVSSSCCWACLQQQCSITGEQVWAQSAGSLGCLARCFYDTKTCLDWRTTHHPKWSIPLPPLKVISQRTSYTRGKHEHHHMFRLVLLVLRMESKCKQGRFPCTSFSAAAELCSDVTMWPLLREYMQLSPRRLLL